MAVRDEVAANINTKDRVICLSLVLKDGRAAKSVRQPV
jgi:hypothetical protein